MSWSSLHFPANASTRARARSFVRSTTSARAVSNPKQKPTRLPNTSLTPAQAVKLQGVLEQLGFFEWLGAGRP